MKKFDPSLYFITDSTNYTEEEFLCRVEQALNALDGVSAQVDLEKKSAFITLSKEVSDETLTKAVTDAGYQVISVE